ncbi:MAG: hypothetical protein V1754_01640 [Pseudomonadota bacterium]
MRFLSFCFVALVCASCGSKTAQTGLGITVTFGEDLTMDQLVADLWRVDIGRESNPQVVLDSKTPITSGVRVLLPVPEQWDGQTVSVEIIGYSGGQSVARGSASQHIKRNNVFEIMVVLCTDQCTVSKRGCVGDQLRICSTDALGCPKWGMLQPCPEDRPSCIDGVCSTACEDECLSQGERQCAQIEPTGIGYQECDNHDSDACLEWGPVVSCGFGETCANGNCFFDCGGKPCTCKPDETQACPDVGECTGGARHCIDGEFGPCEWRTEPTTEVCDGKDNDCNKQIDEGLIAPGCVKQKGVCSGAVQICDGTAGWKVCDDQVYDAHAKSNGFVYEANETLCDGDDNDCDGQIDEPSQCCNPSCGGKACGAGDGCGGICQTGPCPNQQEICVTGACICQPTCVGKVCGANNGCGNACQTGLCSGAQEVCMAGMCICQPDCVGKVCGANDGCGEKCQTGPCPSQQEICQAGICVCQPSCIGKACGADDGCGEECQTGSCSPNATCVSGECNCDFLECGGNCCSVNQVCASNACCTPNCTSRVCGPDPSCSISCGTCASNETCNAQGQCIVDPIAWTHVSSPTAQDLHGIWGNTANNIWVVGKAGVTVRYNGSNWIAGSSSTTNYLEGIWGSSSNDIWAVGGYLMASSIVHYNGSSWSNVSSPTTKWLKSVWGNSASDVWAVAEDILASGDGAIVHYNGSSWSTVVSNTPQALYGIWGGASSDIWAVGGYANSAIMHYNGSAWSSVASPTAENLWAIWGAASNDIWAVGKAGAIVHYNGSVWSNVSSPTTSFLEAIWGSSGSNIWAVGMDGMILNFNGSNWLVVATPTAQTLYGVWGTSDTNAWAVGKSGTIIHYE